MEKPIIEYERLPAAFIEAHRTELERWACDAADPDRWLFTLFKHHHTQSAHPGQVVALRRHRVADIRVVISPADDVFARTIKQAYLT